jgi:uncharacterized protein YxeA
MFNGDWKFRKKHLKFILILILLIYVGILILFSIKLHNSQILTKFYLTTTKNFKPIPTENKEMKKCKNTQQGNIFITDQKGT